MSCLQEFTGRYVDVTLSGNKCITGYLVGIGLDILVINQYGNFYYTPLVHVQNVSLGTFSEGIVETPPTQEHPFCVNDESISFRKALLNARGHFVEIYVSGNTTIHGYLTSIMNDYFVFHSPVYKTIFVTLSHLKWLIPYRDDVTPYALDTDSIPHRSVPGSLPRTFKEQCKKLCGKLVIFDMGDHPNKIGQLKSVDSDSSMAELVTANGTKYLLNMDHLKTVYLP
ncbi:DUF2642 domain-containing protein [Alicyclobacillus dauci]|uniref:DUF2642 domain-containing protein n=1 Tax=Alicyclobacillus dauci TaxID=1475485 RepID=A0ABY6Z2S6_9BACL|nr:DUF2642 domain-containing protein [Alicyclobacillus dauci]WAH36290.1 DUF2642 domain-containing protein [Alicyclobacillus dauci]